MSEEPTQTLPNDNLGRILARLDSIDSRLDLVDSRLTSLGQKVDARSYETKPIWERALKEIIETREEVVKIEGRLSSIENEIKDVRRLFRYTFADVTRT
jgi:tetrahydromethanopterin S-methyltransferase subunit G